MNWWIGQDDDWGAAIARNAKRSLRKYAQVVEEAVKVCSLLAERDQSAAQHCADASMRLNAALLAYQTALAAAGRYRFGDKRYQRRRKAQIEPARRSRLAHAHPQQLSQWLSSVRISLQRACADAELALLVWLGPDVSNFDGSFWSEVEEVAQYLASALPCTYWTAGASD